MVSHTLCLIFHISVYKGLILFKDTVPFLHIFDIAELNAVLNLNKHRTHAITVYSDGIYLI